MFFKIKTLLSLILINCFLKIIIAQENNKPKELSIDEKEIRVGFPAVLTGIIGGSTDQEALKSLNLLINKQNEQNGINNKRIKLIILDNKYDPEEQKKNIDEFKKLKTDIFIMGSGSHPFQAFIPSIEKKENLVLFPLAMSPIFRKPEYKYLIHLIGSSESLGKALITYLTDVLKINKFAIIYQAEPFSQGALEGAKKIISNKKLEEGKDWKAILHKMGTDDFKIIAKDIKDFNPEAIIYLTYFNIFQALSRELKIEYMSLKTHLATDSIMEENLLNYQKEYGLKIFIASVYPEIKTSILSIIKDFREFALTNNIPINANSFAGYFSTILFIDALKKIKNPITKDKIITEIENWKNLDYKGFNLSFNPTTRALLNNIWIIQETETLKTYKISDLDKSELDKEENKKEKSEEKA